MGSLELPPGRYFQEDEGREHRDHGDYKEETVLADLGEEEYFLEGTKIRL